MLPGIRCSLSLEKASTCLGSRCSSAKWSRRLKRDHFHPFSGIPRAPSTSNNPAIAWKAQSLTVKFFPWQGDCHRFDPRIAHQSQHGFSAKSHPPRGGFFIALEHRCEWIPSELNQDLSDVHWIDEELSDYKISNVLIFQRSCWNCIDSIPPEY